MKQIVSVEMSSRPLFPGLFPRREGETQTQDPAELRANQLRVSLPLEQPDADVLLFPSKSERGGGPGAVVSRFTALFAPCRLRAECRVNPAPSGRGGRVRLSLRTCDSPAAQWGNSIRG